jgi:mannose-6-phosphate isomerase-like protein (cupin superfamily)
VAVICAKLSDFRRLGMTEVFQTSTLSEAPVISAPDGSTVRPLCVIPGAGSFAHFRLEPGEIARAVVHATVQEIWFVLAGAGRMWRRQGSREDIVDLRPGVSLTIPLGTAFQFRADDEPLEIVAATMPPWPVDSDDEARPAQGPWQPTF